MTESEKTKCSTCGIEVNESGHLCVPITKKDKTCDWCSSMIVNERHLCNQKVKELTYICNSCGRSAVDARHLCKPEKIK